MSVVEISDADRIRALLEFNGRQAEMIDRLEQSLILQRRANQDLRNQLKEAKEMQHG